MNKRDRIATYYTNARELIKQKNPRAARAYVVEILNEALESYHSASTIISKAKTAVFMEKWIAVSRDLYDKGITDYVLECFGLSAKVERPPEVLTKPSEKVKHDPEPEVQAKPSENVNHIPVQKPEKPTEPSGDIDIAGLVDEAAKTQGWCAEIFEANKTAVVEISVSVSSRTESGTGFIISENGYILTNDHVVFDDVNGVYYSKVNMSFAGEKKTHKVDVLFSDKKADVALCKFNPDEVQSFGCIKRVKDYSKLSQGADCVVIGNAFGMGLAPFSGTVRFTKNKSGNLVYTAPSNPGDSGGPVLNRYGECIGINKSKTVSVNKTAADGYANATPMDTIDELLQKWTSNNGITL